MATNDRILVQCPVTNDGVIERIYVAAVRHGQPTSFETDGVGVMVGSAKTHQAERDATNVALSNAGWGPLRY